MTDCPWGSHLAEYAEGDLPALQREEMGVHLEGCAPCRAALEAQDAAVLALAEFEAPGWSDAFVHDIVQAVHREAAPATATGTEPVRQATPARQFLVNAVALAVLLSIVTWSTATPHAVAWTWTAPAWTLTLLRAVADCLLATVSGLAVAARLALLLLPYLLLYVGSTLVLGLALRGRSNPIPLVR